jgi:hypothetical protein
MEELDGAQRLPDDAHLLPRELPAGAKDEAGEPRLICLGGGCDCGGVPRLQGLPAGRIYRAVATEKRAVA